MEPKTGDMVEIIGTDDNPSLEGYLGEQVPITNLATSTEYRTIEVRLPTNKVVWVRPCNFKLITQSETYSIF